jgi:catalase
VWNDAQREAYVQNVAAHFGNVKNAEVKARQCTSSPSFVALHSN